MLTSVVSRGANKPTALLRVSQENKIKYEGDYSSRDAYRRVEYGYVSKNSIAVGVQVSSDFLAGEIIE